MTAGTGNQAGPVAITGGTIGALLQLSQTTIPGYIQQLDTFASGLISMVNEQHAEGISQNGPLHRGDRHERGQQRERAAGAGGARADADPGPAHDQRRGQRDRRADAGHDLRQSRDREPERPRGGHQRLAGAISPPPSAEGKLSISAASGYSFDFAANQGTNILAALGINPFFQGTNASNIQLAAALVNNPAGIAAGQSADSGDGSNAAAISNLKSMASAAFGGNSLAGYWQTTVNNIGTDAQNATQTQTTAQNMVDTVTTQEQAISGVSLDEEAANVLQYQQLYRRLRSLPGHGRPVVADAPSISQPEYSP